MPTNLPTWHQRSDLAAILNERKLTGVGVEVGVQTGLHAADIRRNWKGELLIGVDPWRPYGTDVTEEMHNDYAKIAMERLRATDKNFALLRMTSVEAAEWLKSMLNSTSTWGVERKTRAPLDPLLDFVYLDGDHGYEAVKEDIEAWYPLIRSGGILAGHDWVVDGWHRHGQPYDAVPEALGAETGPGPFYVRKAVNERFKPEEISVTDPETDMGWQSFLVVKP